MYVKTLIFGEDKLIINTSKTTLLWW